MLLAVVLEIEIEDVSWRKVWGAALGTYLGLCWCVIGPLWARAFYHKHKDDPDWIYTQGNTNYRQTYYLDPRQRTWVPRNVAVWCLWILSPVTLPIRLTGFTLFTVVGGVLAFAWDRTFGSVERYITKED